MKSTIFFSPISILLLFFLLIYNTTLFSQVKIGDNPKLINPDAMLEIESSNKGLLLTRISLKSTTTASPLKNFTQGMVVYNISTLNDVTPGLYFSDGKKWIKANTNVSAVEPTSNQNVIWNLKGNNDVTTGNFLGSINNAPVIIKTNNNERLRVTEKGWVGVGTSNPNAALQVKGQMIIDTISAGSLTTDKILVANPSDGRVKYIPASSFTNGVQNYSETVASNGKSIFTTPSIITDANKIFLYRNGVLISFTLNNNNSIVSELPCNQGDQIRIIQLL